MLQNLHVKNLALIDEAEVDFSGGLNILTGETGAGKSIILGSVSLALGGRYSADMLRKGADKGLVELTFYVENPETVRKLEEMDLSPDGGQIIITRRFNGNRSVSRINGETVTLGRLKEAGGVTAAVLESLKESDNCIDAKVCRANGSQECKKALLLMKVGRLPEDFIEGMACDGGCVGGPSSFNDQMASKKNRDALISQADDRGILDNLKNYDMDKFSMHRD